MLFLPTLIFAALALKMSLFLAEVALDVFLPVRLLLRHFNRPDRADRSIDKFARFPPSLLSLRTFKSRRNKTFINSLQTHTHSLSLSSTQHTTHVIMGIKGLMRVINEKAPGAVKEMTIKGFTGRTVAIDASMAIYQFLVRSSLRFDRDGARFRTRERESTSSQKIRRA